jgi:methionyl aminopeptidase
LIILKSDEEIDAMRPAGHLAFDLLNEVASIVRPGISTQDINEFIHNYTEKRGGISAPLNYKGFPKSVCTSINEVVCHGIPSPTAILKEGDIINIDVTPIVDGYHGDSSRTYFVGSVSDEARRVTECAKKCLDAAIAVVQDGCRVGDIGAEISAIAHAQGYSVVREFVGHGLGKNFHEDPQIPHFGNRGRGTRLTKGMVFTIEPMINVGVWQTKMLKDGWTAVTADKKLSAQFEHTLAIRSDGKVEILTLPN